MNTQDLSTQNLSDRLNDTLSYNLTDEALINLINTYFESIATYDSENTLYPMSELDEAFNYEKATTIYDALCHSDFAINDSYFVVERNRYLYATSYRSLNQVLDCYIDDIIDYIITNNNSLNNNDIQNILDNANSI